MLRSGVVGEDGSMVTTTELPLAMTFFTPHKTIDGKQMLLTVGVGKDISVNCLLGLPFSRELKQPLIWKLTASALPSLGTFEVRRCYTAAQL